MREKKVKNRYWLAVVAEVNDLEINQSFSKIDFIKQSGRDYDFYTDRSFTVLFSKARKLFPDRQYKCIKARITRIK